jgi:hypothetical protein
MGWFFFALKNGEKLMQSYGDADTSRENKPRGLTPNV